MLRKTIVAFLFVCTNLYSQHTDTSLYMQIDVAPRWIWRGVAYSESPVIQPSVGYADNKFTAYVWGSYNITKGEYHELDFVIEYKPIEQIKIGFTDYFGIPDSSKNKQQFFNLNNKKTSHTLDLYTCIQPFKKLPLSFSWSTWFYGNDKDLKTHQQLYSTYIETRYEKKYKNINLHTFIGCTPFKSYYYQKVGIVNIGLGLTKQFTLTNKISMPLKVEFILNPSTENVYINAVLGIK